MTTTPKNGIAAPGAAAKNTTKPETSNTAITEKGTAVPVQPSPKVLTVEDRKGRATIFNLLLEKQEKLKDAQTKLDGFIVGSDENSQHITLKDGNGKTFQTGKSDILKPVIDLMRKQLAQQVGTVEAEILEFVI